MKTKRRKIYNKKTFRKKKIRKKTFNKKKFRKTFNKKTFKKKFRNLKGGMFGWTRPKRYTYPNIEKSPDPNIVESPDTHPQDSPMTMEKYDDIMFKLSNRFPNGRATVHGVGRPYLPRS